MSLSNYIATGVINLGLRGFALAGKFAFVLYLSRYLTLEDLGVYGLLAAFVGFSIQIIGLDYYVYNTRMILANPGPSHQLSKIREQLDFHAIIYAIAIPLLIFVVLIGIIPFQWAVVLPVLFIVFAEHVSQESSRLLTTLSRSPEANLVFFVRTGCWMLLFVLLAYHFPILNKIDTVIIIWAIGVAISACLGVYRIWRIYKEEYLARQPIQLSFQPFSYLKFIVPFFIGTIMLQLIQISDRFFIEHYLGSASVGVYVFSHNLASLLQTLAVIGLITVIAPKIIQTYMSEERYLYRKNYNIMIIAVLVLLLLSIPIFLFLFPYIANISGKDEIIASDHLFSLILAGQVLAVLAMLPYYGLYIRKMDWTITITTGLGALVNIILNIALIPRFGLHGAAIATCIAFTLVLLVRLFIVLGGIRAQWDLRVES